MGSVGCTRMAYARIAQALLRMGSELDGLVVVLSTYHQAQCLFTLGESKEHSSVVFE